MKKAFLTLAVLCAVAMMAGCKDRTAKVEDAKTSLAISDSRKSLCERFPEYDDCGPVFYNGFTWVRKGELLGIADSNGKLLTPVKWDMVDLEDHNYFLVESDGKTYIIDTFGNLTETDEKIDWSGEGGCENFCHF